MVVVTSAVSIMVAAVVILVLVTKSLSVVILSMFATRAGAVLKLGSLKEVVSRNGPKVVALTTMSAAMMKRDVSTRGVVYHLERIVILTKSAVVRRVNVSASHLVTIYVRGNQSPVLAVSKTLAGAEVLGIAVLKVQHASIYHFFPPNFQAFAFLPWVLVSKAMNHATVMRTVVGMGWLSRGKQSTATSLQAKNVNSKEHDVTAGK